MLDGRATLGLSRALGDGWAVPLGLTSEPDAITIRVCDPVSGAVDFNTIAAAPASPLDSLASGSCASCDPEEAPCPPARHVLVLGCDGLWDVVGNADAVAIALRWAWAAWGSLPAAAFAIECLRTLLSCHLVCV
jgi:RNA polymerase II C-terminal domain phosphatase-like 3/4